MTIATFNTAPVTAKSVRAFYQDEANADRLAALSEAAQHTVAKGSRGRLHPDVRADYNSDRKPSEQYNEGAPKTVTLTYKRVTKSGSRNKVVSVPEAEARALAGALAGKRGPLSKAAKAAAAEALAAQVNASE